MRSIYVIIVINILMDTEVVKGQGGVTMSSVLSCTSGEHSCASLWVQGTQMAWVEAAGAALGTSVGLQWLLVVACGTSGTCFPSRGTNGSASVIIIPCSVTLPLVKSYIS